MDILMILTVGTLNIVCFFVGSKIGQTVIKGKDIEAPNPVKAVKEYKEQREVQRETNKEISKLETIMKNIENYDGTPNKQEDIPR